MFKSATFVLALAAYAQANQVVPDVAAIEAAADAAGVDAGAAAAIAGAAGAGGVPAAGDLDAALGDLENLINEVAGAAGAAGITVDPAAAAGAAGAAGAGGAAGAAGLADALSDNTDLFNTEESCKAGDGVWAGAFGVGTCTIFDDTECPDSGCYTVAFGMNMKTCQTKEICDELRPSSAGLVIAIIVCLLAAVAVGILVYCLCCKSKGDDDYDKAG